MAYRVFANFTYSWFSYAADTNKPKQLILVSWILSALSHGREMSHGRRNAYSVFELHNVVTTLYLTLYTFLHCMRRRYEQKKKEKRKPSCGTGDWIGGCLNVNVLS